MTSEQTTGPWVITDSRDVSTRRYLKTPNGGWSPEWTDRVDEAHLFTARIDMLVVTSVLTRQHVYAVSVPLADVLDVRKAA